jgi:hypothetical protein
MTKHSTSVKQELDAGEQPYRRRTTDNPQPLDYMTRELVREIIEKRQQDKPTPKETFIQKLLKRD